jgi:hypothetical protein
MNAMNALTATASDRALTLNERLNKVCEALQFQCERIEAVVNRANGHPQPPAPGHKVGGDVARILPTLPMATVTEHLEALQARIADLATHAERIA